MIDRKKKKDFLSVLFLPEKFIAECVAFIILVPLNSMVKKRQQLNKNSYDEFISDKNSISIV